MLDFEPSDNVINLRRMSAEYYQKAAWNQLLALDNYREKNFEVAERFAQLSFEDQIAANEYAELADAEFSLHLLLELEDQKVAVKCHIVMLDFNFYKQKLDLTNE